MSIVSYRMEHVMGELNYWTYLISRWRVGWIEGSEHKPHGKMAILFAQPYINPECQVMAHVRTIMHIANLSSAGVM
jgi:hypothetical protein